MDILRNQARKDYIKLIFNAKNKEKERNTDKNEYYEIHHILPKSIFPQYKTNIHNLVKLTYKEHFIAHKLLSEFIPCYSTKIAFYIMSHLNNKNRQERNFEELTPEEYELSRKARNDAYKLRDSETIKNICKKVNETIHSRYTKEEITEFHRKGWRTLLESGNFNLALEKRKETIANFTEEEKENYINNKRKAGKCSNTEEIKLKRKQHNIIKFGGNGGCLNNEESLKKYRNTLKNKDKKLIDEWKYKCGLACKGKHYWTNGIITKRSVECPGEGFVLGRGPHKKSSANFKKGKNPKAIRIEIIETKEIFDCIKDLCIKYNVKISTIRKFAIREEIKLWKINKVYLKNEGVTKNEN